LYVTSGTQGNLISCMVHCDRRDSEAIVGDQCHIHVYEQGNMSTIGGIHVETVKNQPDGTLDLEELESKIRGDDVHCPVTRLVCLENTAMKCGGRCISAEYTDKLGALCKRKGIKFHLDGARLFNASVKLGVPVKRLAQAADSVSICLSKGLGAPIGSVICGTRDFVRTARRYRKALGGGMRQVGIIAAPGIVALTEMVDRLKDDHENAHTLATQLSTVKGLELDAKTVETNIVYCTVQPKVLGKTAEEFRDALKAKGVLITGSNSNSKVRFVTNHHITADDVPKVIALVKDVAKS